MGRAEGVVVKRDVVVLGASAGGFQAIKVLLDSLPAEFDASLLVVLHRSPTFCTDLAKVIGRNAAVPVAEAQDGELLERGCVYIAPRDQHLTVRGNALFLDRGPKQHHTRPAIDPLFVSASSSHGDRVIGVLLTGHLSDGVTGLVDIKDRGGISLAQDPDEAPYPSMPLNAVLHDHVDLIVRIRALGQVLQALVSGDPVESAAAIDGTRRLPSGQTFGPLRNAWTRSG